MDFNQRKAFVEAQYEALVTRENKSIEGNGIFNRYEFPIVTDAHTPLLWRYDYNPETNPYFMERIGVNATLNAGLAYTNLAVEMDKVSKSILQNENIKPVVTYHKKYTPFLDSWIYLLAIVLLFGIEWFMRKWGGGY